MAFTSTNMFLRVWNQLTDLFSHSDLQANWGIIDTHDHSTGKGIRIGTAGLATAAVTNTQLATGTITGDKLNSTTTLTIAGLTDTGPLSVTGATSLHSDVSVTGNLSAGSTLAVTSSATIGGTLVVTGASQFNGNVGISGNVSFGGTLAVSGTTSLQTATATTLSTNSVTTGALGVTGDATISGGLTVAGGTVALSATNLGAVEDFLVSGNTVTLAAWDGALGSGQIVLSAAAASGLPEIGFFGATPAPRTSGTFSHTSDPLAVFIAQQLNAYGLTNIGIT